MAAISQIRIKDSTQQSGYADREIGAQAINVTVGYDSKGNIITDGKTSPVTTKNAAEALKDGLDPVSHASNTDKYGAASKAEYGHVKIGGGIDVADGVISVSYGNTAGTVTEGNDSRLSDDRPNPQVITFSDGTTKVEYDGSKKVDITLDTLDGAPSAHTSVIADANTLGHVKLSDDYTGTTTESGVAASSAGLQAAYAALNGSLTEVKKSVSDGKSTVASAITNKGVSTASDATFDTMSTNISNIPNRNSGTYTPTSRSSSIDMGYNNTYRYVNTDSVPNTNSATYTPSSNGSALDMGATNTYRYVNTNTVYNSGYNSGYSARPSNVKYSNITPTGATCYSSNDGSWDAPNMTERKSGYDQSSSNKGMCYIKTGSPSVSVNDSIITITIPQTVRSCGRFGTTGTNGSSYTDYSRNLVVKLSI